MYLSKKMLPGIFDNLNVKVLLYASKIRFRKYPALLYPFYMYLIYRYLLKRRKKFKIVTVPLDSILYIFDRYSAKCTFDPNNCAIVPRKFASSVDLGDYASITDDFAKKTVQTFGFDIPEDVVYVSDTLACNLAKIPLCGDSVRFISIPNTSIRIAEEVEIKLINSGYEVTNGMCDVLLKNYFRTPKLVRKGDTIAVNVQNYAPEFIYNNFKTNSIETVYFKCAKIKFGADEDCSGSYFCVKGASELKQSAHAQDYLPLRSKRFLKVKFERTPNLESALINKCPYGFEDRLDQLTKAIKPFLKHKNVKLKPVFLIQGNKGNGKNRSVQILADELGLNYFKISSGDVSATAYSQMEIKIKNAFFKAKLCAPSLFVINNFENFGKNHEGRFSERIIDYFKVELSNNLTNNDPPMIVICINNSKGVDVPAELSRLFLEIFDFGAPDQGERARILDWMLEEKGLESAVSMEEIAGKTHGFLYGDLDALVYHAWRNGFVREGGTKEEIGDRVSEDDFNFALDTMQANYAESMGAPKVPKVQWSDVGGLGDVKDEIIRTINLPLKRPGLHKRSGLRRSGILLYGPPGTGKTLLAKVVATECGLCFLSVKGPELLNMYVGQSEQNVREVFERAREASPCIIFFDELDSLAPNRGISGDSGGVMDRVVSQLLSEMDGLNKEATIFVIGATNRPDLIDPALLRPGRFDKLLYVGPPETAEAKLNVLEALTRKFKLAENTNLEEVITNCPENISGADFYGLCSKAWMSGARRLIKKIENGEIDKDDVSHEDIVVGPENFMEAIKTIKPSINPQDMRYFERLKRELSSNKS